MRKLTFTNTDILKKDLKTTSIVDISDFGKIKIHITDECSDIIYKNMNSGKVNPMPLEFFLPEQNNVKNEEEADEYAKNIFLDSKLTSLGITKIEMAFNDTEILNRLSDVKVDENYYLLWVEASISFIKYLLGNKQLKIEYPKQYILNNIHKEIEAARKER